MVFKFDKFANYNKHPLIIRFNAGIGMSLSIIPLIIVKTKSHRDKKNDKLNQQLSLKGTLTRNSFGDLNYIEKYDKKK